MRKISFIKVLVPLLFAVLSGCGYRPLLIEKSKKNHPIQVPIVENHTVYKGVAPELTSSLRKRLKRYGVKIVSVSRNSGKAHVLKADILHIKDSPGLLKTENNRVAQKEIVWKGTIRVELTNSDGETLAGPLSITEEMGSLAGETAGSEDALGATARSALLDRLAERAVLFVLENI